MVDRLVSLNNVFLLPVICHHVRSSDLPNHAETRLVMISNLEPLPSLKDPLVEFREPKQPGRTGRNFAEEGRAVGARVMRQSLLRRLRNLGHQYRPRQRHMQTKMQEISGGRIGNPPNSGDATMGASLR